MLGYDFEKITKLKEEIEHYKKMYIFSQRNNKSKLEILETLQSLQFYLSVVVAGVDTINKESREKCKILLDKLFSLVDELNQRHYPK